MSSRLAVPILIFGSIAVAQPQISDYGVANAASYGYVGLPDQGIAQGSMFVTFGAGLGPASLTQAEGLPLPVELGGTRVDIQAGGAMLAAPVVYTSATQVAAILPSNTPLGQATVIIVYNDRASTGKSINIVPSNFGIFTSNQAGTGRASITDTASRALDLMNAANPGDLVSIWGTGLGPVSFPDDRLPQPIDMKNLQVRITIGGRPAEILYRGRSGCCAGVDQIVFKVPVGVTGCYEAVYLAVGNVISNTATIPVTEPPSRVCADAAWLSGTDMQALTGKSSFSLGYQSLTRAEDSQGGDTGVSTFYRFNVSDYDFSLLQPPEPGSCEVTVQTTPFNWVPVTAARLDAGGAISIVGPKGTKLIPKTDDLYVGNLGVGYLVPGVYALSNGSGGSKIGSFRVGVTVPQPLAWTNRDAFGVVLRAEGVTLRWTGGDSEGTILIMGNVAKGQFTVPPRIVMALPPDQAGILALGAETNQTRFTASGLDLGFASFYEQLTRTVAYQ